MVMLVVHDDGCDADGDDFGHVLDVTVVMKNLVTTADHVITAV